MTEAIGPWSSSLPSYKEVNNKRERNDRGKCLGWSVNSYGPGYGVSS